MFQQATNRLRLGPQPAVFYKNAEPVCRTLRHTIAHTGQRGDAGNTAPCALQLHHRLHRTPAFNVRLPDGFREKI